MPEFMLGAGIAMVFIFFSWVVRYPAEIMDSLLFSLDEGLVGYLISLLVTGVLLWASYAIGYFIKLFICKG